MNTNRIPGRGKPNQEPTTARGKRRSAETPGYLAAFEARQKQTHPGGNRPGHVPGRPKGPSKRPPGLGHDEWARLMAGKG